MATMTAENQHVINQIPDPVTRRSVQILVESLLAELEKKADAQ